MKAILGYVLTPEPPTIPNLTADASHSKQLRSRATDLAVQFAQAVTDLSWLCCRRWWWAGYLSEVVLPVVDDVGT